LEIGNVNLLESKGEGNV